MKVYRGPTKRPAEKGRRCWGLVRNRTWWKWRRCRLKGNWWLLCGHHKWYRNIILPTILLFFILLEHLANVSGVISYLTDATKDFGQKLDNIEARLIPKDFVGEYLQEVLNYKHVGNVDKALERSLEVLKTNPNSLDALYYAASAYIVKKDDKYYNSAKDLLNSKLNILTAREKALLGFAEYKLKNDTKSYNVLSGISLFDLDNEILPYVLIALVQTAFNTYSYNEAIDRMQAPLDFIKRKAKYLDLEVSRVGENTIKGEMDKDYWRIVSSQLKIGDTWLVHAYNNRRMNDWIMAIKVSTDGFHVCCNVVNTKKDILNYLSSFNEVLKFPKFIESNTEKILEIITHYIEVLSRMNYNVPQKLDHPISLEEGHWGERNNDDVATAA